MAIIHAEQMRYDQAEPLFQEALSIMEKDGGSSELLTRIKNNYNNMIIHRNLYGKK